MDKCDREYELLEKYDMLNERVIAMERVRVRILFRALQVPYSAEWFRSAFDKRLPFPTSMKFW